MSLFSCDPSLDAPPSWKWALSDFTVEKCILVRIGRPSPMFAFLSEFCYHSGALDGGNTSSPRYLDHQGYVHCRRRLLFWTLETSDVLDADFWTRQESQISAEELACSSGPKITCGMAFAPAQTRPEKTHAWPNAGSPTDWLSQIPVQDIFSGNNAYLHFRKCVIIFYAYTP